MNLSEQKGFILWGVGLKVSKHDRETINRLLKQLSKKTSRLNNKDIEGVLGQPNYRVVVARDLLRGRILGMAGICFYKTFSHKRGKGVIEDVVVNKRCRGLGIGKALLKDLIGLAAVKFVSKLELTSNPKRKEANELYVKLGFKIRETNCYERRMGRKDRPY